MGLKGRDQTRFPVFQPRFFSPRFAALLIYRQGVRAMNIASPFVVVPIIVLVFAICIFFATSTKEDGPSAE